MGAVNLAVGEGSVWMLVMAQTPDAVIVNIDPLTNTVSGYIDAPPNTQFVAWGDGSLWAETVTELHRLDPADGRVIATIPTGQFPFMLSFGYGSVWSDFPTAHETITQVDAETNTVVGQTALPDRDGFAIWHGNVAFGGGYVWANGPASVLVKIDPATATIVEQYLPGGIGGAVAATDTDVWFVDYAGNRLYRLRLG